MSNGIGSFIIFAMRGSFITFAFTRSRWARDLYTIHEKQTVSPLFTLASRGKATHFRLQVVAYAFPVLQGAVVAPDLAGPLRDAAIGLHVALRDGEDETIDVSHCAFLVIHGSGRHPEVAGQRFNLRASEGT